MPPRGAALLLVAAQLAQQARALPPRSFGVGYTASQAPVCAKPTLLLNYSLSPDAELGLLTHFWCTGDIDRNVIVEYFVDGEASPSIAFEPSMATGQGFPQFVGDDPLAQQASLYEAAGKMGKAGPIGGFYNKFKIPFSVSLLAQIRLINGSDCQYAYIQIRGHEVGPGDPGVVLPGGAALPRAARMVLQKIENSTFPALSQVALANVSRGMSAVLFLTTMATSTYPPQNNYIEGCFHVTRSADEAFPGLVVGTGFEDYFNSAYWFGAASGFADGVLFQQADSGLVHFSVSAPKGAAGVEMLSAYRFHDGEVLGMEDGGRLIWRVGDTDGKCFETTTHNPIGTPSAVAVKSYVWLYEWPNGGPVEPLPPIPQPGTISYTCGSGGKCEVLPDASGPYLFANCDEQCKPVPVPTPVPGPPAVVGCASGECDAFCGASSLVHGCVAEWDGALSLRAPPSGAPCGGKLGKCTTSPADACAPGWAICLSFNGSAATTLDGFRAGIGKVACAAEATDPRKFVAAMSHARAAWSSLPPAPCPPAPVSDDNGCVGEGWGAEPVCCGGACVEPSCPNSVWSGGTRIHIDENAACAALAGGVADGVLCCKVGA